MKFLTPKEVKDNREEAITKGILRLRALRDAIKEAEKEYNNTDARFEVALANQKLRWANEEKDAVERIEALKREIKNFSEEKARLLIPIDQKREEAHTILKQAEEKRDEADALLDVLHKRLDEVSDKEYELSMREQRIEIKEKALEGQANMIKISIKNNG